MAEKREERTKHELLSVVVNFESLRFMALVEENYLISDLITEAENTFTKLCSTKVTIKTLKNSVNAVLPDWYPVAPLIKNGDEIFAFRDTAADVMNNNFSRPTNRHFTKNTSANPKCSVHDSSFSSGISAEKNDTNKTDQQETQGTRMDGVIKTTGSGFEESVDLGGVISDQESERLSETFSFQPVNRNISVYNSQGIMTEKIGNEIGQKSEDVESKMSNANNLVVTGMTMKESASVQKSKNHDISNSDSTDGRASNLRKCTNDSGVSVGGRSSTIDHSKAHESKTAQKLQKQSTRTKNTATEVNGEFEKSHYTGKNSDDNSLRSGGSSGDKERKERTPVQNGSPVDSAKQKKGDSNSDKRDSTKKLLEKSTSKSKDESEESSDDDKGNVETTSVKATGEERRKNSDQKSSEVSENEASSIRSDSSKSTPPAKAPKKPQCKKPKIISIKFTKPDKASPACKIKTEVVDLSDSDGESSWTESSEMNTPKKTPQAEDGDNKGEGKSSQVKGNDGKDKAMEAADDSDNESNDKSQSTDNEKPYTQTPASGHADGVKNVVDTTTHKSNGLDKNEKAKILDAAADSDSEDSDSSEKPLTQLPAKTGGKPKRAVDNPVSTPNDSNKKAKAKILDAAADSDSEDSDSSGEKALTQLPAKTGGKPKRAVDNPVSTPNNSNKKAKAKILDAAADSDSEDSDSSGEKALTQLPAKTGGKPKRAVDNPVSTPNNSNKKAKAKTAEAASESDNESSDNSSEKALRKRPAKTNGKSKDPVDHPAAGTSKVTAKIPEAGNDSDNESSDSSSSEETFKQPPAKTNSKANGAVRNLTRSSKSSDKKPTARTMVVTEVDFGSDTKHAGKPIDDSDSTGSRNSKNAAETNAKSARSTSNAKQNVSLKRTGPETPKNQKQLQKDSMKSSPRIPHSPTTPRSRKAAVDKSKSKVASWLLANDVPASACSCDNTSISDQGRIMTRAQKSKKRARKKTHGRKKGRNEEQESEKTAEPKLSAKSQDTTTICSREQVPEDGPTLGSPKKATGKSQKRKQNETAEMNHEEQLPSKNAKRRRQKMKPNDKNKANEDDDHQEKDTSESDKNEASSTVQLPPVDSGKRKTTTLTLPKKSKGLSALLEDDDDDNFENFQTPKKPKRTPIWSDRPKPTGFLTPSNSIERKSTGPRSGKQRSKILSSSQRKQAVELNVKEKELLSSGALNLETLLNDESITW